MAHMHNPPHPGEILKEDVLPGLGLTVTEAAKQLRITRPALSRILNAKAGISAEMAIRLAQWLGGSSESWLHMQAAYDLWQAAQHSRPRITPARRAA